MATRFTESGVKYQISVAWGIRAKRLPFVSITPLGRPVVPEE